MPSVAGGNKTEQLITAQFTLQGSCFASGFAEGLSFPLSMQRTAECFCPFLAWLDTAARAREGAGE